METNFGLILGIMLVVALMLTIFLGKNKVVMALAYFLAGLAVLLYFLYTVGLLF